MQVEIRGRKYRAVTAAQMREMDRRAIEEYGIPGLILMENAGRGMAAMIAHIHERRKCAGPILIFCGKGNNGGDSFVIARHLHNAALPVKIFFLGTKSDIAPKSDSGINYSIIRKMRLDMRSIAGSRDVLRDVLNCGDKGIIVDALLGTGLKRKVGEPLASLMAMLNLSKAYTVAVDTPSGLDCTTGKILGCAVRADETLTCGLPKVGFFKGEGPRLVGRLHVVDISLPREIL
jgi:NAD(P)H-hydrate epimerase